MATPLGKLFSFLALPPPTFDPNYEGLEYRWKWIVVRPGLLKTEGILLGVVLAYCLFYAFGYYKNQRTAKAWLNAHLHLLESQFSRPSSGELIRDGPSDFFNFSTGRRNIKTLHSRIHLLPRHDTVLTLFETIWSFVQLDWSPQEFVQLDFTLASPPSSSATPGFVWAVVPKNALRVRNERWDLTFTRTTENPQLGSQLTVMSEYADITESMFKLNTPNFSLVKLLTDPAIQPYLMSLIVTDQYESRPKDVIPQSERNRHLILTLRPPPPSKAASVVPFVKSIFTLVDLVETKLALRPDTKGKLRKVRDDLDVEIKKEAEAEKREEAEDAKIAEKKRLEDERVGKLSSIEQQKYLERQRQKKMRKASQGGAKMVKK